MGSPKIPDWQVAEIFVMQGPVVLQACMQRRSVYPYVVEEKVSPGGTGPLAGL